MLNRIASTRTHRNLLDGTIAAAAGTAVYFLWHCTSWPWVFSLPFSGMLGEIVGLLFFMVCVCIPYAVLVGLLSFSEKSPVFQVLSFSLVVGLTVYMYGSVRLGKENSGGWEFVIVPLMQLALELFLFTIWRVQAVLFGRSNGTKLPNFKNEAK